MSNVPCPDDDRLEQLLDDRLSAVQATEIERHVESCDRCRAALEQLTSPPQKWRDEFRDFVGGSEGPLIDCLALADRVEQLTQSVSHDATRSSAQRLIETSRIGDYDLLAELRGGGMGRVFRVRHCGTEEILALKVLTSERLPRPESVQRFQREIRLLRDLRHQHVVRAIDSGMWRGVPFVVMEFLDGIDLSELVQRHGPLSVPDALELTRQMALGLRYVHELKLVHRDVKPSNVMLTADRVCLLDLGLARVTETDWDATGPTMTGEALGTLRYAAPEQLGRAHEVDARADLYGLGGTLLWLLTGQPPFADADPRKVWRRKLEGRVARPESSKGVEIDHALPKASERATPSEDPALEALAARVDGDVLALLCRLLAVSPEDRPDSVDAVLPELERLATGHQIGALWERVSSARGDMPLAASEKPISVVMSVLEPVTSPAWRRALPIAGIVGVFVIAAVWWTLANRRSPTPRGSDDPDARTQNAPRNDSATDDALAFAADFRWPESRVAVEPVPRSFVRSQPLSTQALVSQPAAMDGVDSWTVETRQPRSHLYEVAFSTDGRCYATGDDTGVVRVFESATDRLLRLFVVASRVRSLDWSSAGPWLAIGCSEPDVTVFDVATGRRLAHLRLESGIIHCVRWHPDGVRLALVGGKGVLIHDLQTGDSREVDVPDTDGIVSLSWSPDGTRVMTGDRRGRIRIWNANDGTLNRELPRQAGRLSHVAWSPDGNAVSFATDKGQVEVHSLDGSAAWSLAGHFPQAFPLESHWLNRTTLLTNDGLALRWFPLPDAGASRTTMDDTTAERLEPQRTLLNPLQNRRQVHGGGTLHRLAVSRDGTEAVCALRFARRVWRVDLASGTTRVVGEESPSSGFDAHVAWSPRGRWIAMAQQTRGVWVIDARTLEPHHFVPMPELVGSVAWSPDDQRLAAIGADQVSIFSNLDAPQLERRTLPRCGSITCSWSPDGKWLSTSAWGDKRSHAVRLLDTETWSEAARVPVVSDAYLIHAWSPDHTSLAIGTDQEVRILDVASRTWKETFPLGNRVNGLSWHPTERLLAAITFDGRPRVINIANGETRDLDAINNPATGILWSADGQRILAQFGRDLGCFDWPSGTLRWRQPLNGHTIESLAQSPSGNTLVVAINGELRLHDSPTGRRVVTLLTAGEQNWLRLSPDGHCAGSPGIELELVIVHESNGVQSVATLSSFAAQSGRKNEPNRTSLTTLKLGWQDWPIDAPQPAVAPFSAEQAARHQRAWANYLGLPVEHTNSIGMKLRLIPPGEFDMGGTDAEVELTLKFTEAANKEAVQNANSERPQHRVVLTQPFYLGCCEITQSQFESVVGRNPSQFAATGANLEHVAKVAGSKTANHPVENVSRSDAAEFCATLSQREQLAPFYFRAGDNVTDLKGTGYRLPTEAEWEFACRAGSTTPFWSGPDEADFLRVGWGGANSGGRTHPVGELPANPFGLHDTHGNVFEWTQDAWSPSFYSPLAEKVTTNPLATTFTNRLGALRGGSWLLGAMFCRSSFRFAFDASGRLMDSGFRVALPVETVRAVLRVP